MRPSWHVLKKALLILVLIMVTAGAIHLTRPERAGDLNIFGAWARDAAAPVQHAVWRTSRAAGAGAAFVFSLGRDTRRVRALEEKIAGLEGEIRRLRAVEKENERLKALLAYKTTSTEPSIVAAVISRNTTNWFGTVIINRGKKDGVRRGAAVITPAGAVGKVLTVSGRTAEVLLITDPRSAVGSIVYETQVPGIVRGTLAGSERLKMEYVVKDEPVRKGFLIITSSLSDLFPPGIPVGTVTGVEEGEGGIFKIVYLKPAVDLNRLEEVLVLLKQ